MITVNKKTGVLALALAWLSLTGCANLNSALDGAPLEPGISPGGGGTTAQVRVQTVSYEVEGIAFDVPSDWVQAEGTHMFFTADREQAYGLNGISALGSYTPQEFFEELASYYEESGQQELTESSEPLAPWLSADGVSCEAGLLYGRQGSVLYLTRVIVAPQKNLAMTFSAQAQERECDPEEVRETLDALCESLTFEVGSQDYISGNTFQAGDGSQLCLQDDGSFRYYQSADDPDSPYYEGVYEVWYGQPAADQVVSMTEYGWTAEELQQVLTANMNGYIPGDSSPLDYLYATGELEDTRTRYQVCLDTFYAVILHNQRLVYSPDEVNEGGNSVLYIGYYLPELNMADLTNANAASHTQWTLQGKTN